MAGTYQGQQEGESRPLTCTSSGIPGKGQRWVSTHGWVLCRTTWLEDRPQLQTLVGRGASQRAWQAEAQTRVHRSTRRGGHLPAPCLFLKWELTATGTTRCWKTNWCLREGPTEAETKGDESVWRTGDQPGKKRSQFKENTIHSVGR